MKTYFSKEFLLFNSILPSNLIKYDLMPIKYFSDMKLYALTTENVLWIGRNGTFSYKLKVQIQYWTTLR